MKKKLKILLVGCPKQVEGTTRAVVLPNLGICSLAANVSKDICETKVVDLIFVEKKYKEYYEKLLKEYQPDVVGISAMIFQEKEVSKIAQLTKDFNDKIITIIGGYHASTLYDTILEDERFTVVDYVMRREAELSFSMFVEAIYYGSDFKEVPNLSFRENGKVVHTENGEMINLDELSLPDRESRIFKKGFHFLGYKADMVETSRGCVNDCNYCSITQMHYKRFRKFKVERILEDIKLLKANGIKVIIFADDNITLDPKRFMKLCQAIIDSKCNNIKYIIQSSITIYAKYPEVLPLMKKAGFWIIYIGLESSENETLKFLSKDNVYEGINTRETLKNIRSNGIFVIAGIIIGNPDDTEEKILSNLDYVNSIQVPFPLFLPLTPYPKTEIRKIIADLDLLTNPEDYSKYDLMNVNIRTKYLSAERIFELREYLGFQLFRKPVRLWYLIQLGRFNFIKLFFNALVSQPLDTFGYFWAAFKPEGLTKEFNKFIRKNRPFGQA